MSSCSDHTIYTWKNGWTFWTRLHVLICRSVCDLCVSVCRLQIHQDLREELAKVKNLESLADVSRKLRLRCQVTATKIVSGIVWLQIQVVTQSSLRLLQTDWNCNWMKHDWWFFYVNYCIHVCTGGDSQRKGCGREGGQPALPPLDLPAIR